MHVSHPSSVVPISTSELVHPVLFSEFLSFDFYHVCLCFVNEEVRAFCSQLYKTKLSPVCMPGTPGVFIDGHRFGRVPPLSWKDWGRAFFPCSLRSGPWLGFPWGRIEGNRSPVGHTLRFFFPCPTDPSRLRFSFIHCVTHTVLHMDMLFQITCVTQQILVEIKLA